MDLEEERLAERKAVEKKQQEEAQKMNLKQSLEEERAIHKRLKDLNSNSGSGKFNLPYSELSCCCSHFSVSFFKNKYKCHQPLSLPQEMDYPCLQRNSTHYTRRLKEMNILETVTCRKLCTTTVVAFHFFLM